MKKILISDIDGTLIRNGKVATDRIKLEKFRNSNTFVLCTGRNYDSFNSFVHKYSFDTFDFAILSNGAMLIDKAFNILYAKKIGLTELKEQVTKLVEITGINRLFLVINLKEITFNTVTALSKALEAVKETDTIIGLTIELTSKQAAQVCFNKINRNTSLSIQHNHSYIDIIVKGTSKKVGIETLLSKLAYSSVQVIGDGQNDIPMFEVTKESYTFYDSPEIVKDKANFFVEFYDDIFEI